MMSPFKGLCFILLLCALLSVTHVSALAAGRDDSRHQREGHGRGG